MTSSRTELDIEGRAIAVAEPGADLSWSVAPDGEADVRQTRGSVFYRVSTGGAFEVDTPGGRVIVTGTCFTVEIVPMRAWMKEHAAGLAVGAAVGAAVVLTVHEGSVVLANDRGEIEVAAGERAHAHAGREPMHLADGDEADQAPGIDTVSSLRAEVVTQRRRIAELEREVSRSTDPEGTPTTQSRAEQVRACANSVGRPGCSLVDPDPDVLEEMARCGSIKVDAPPFLTKRTDGYAPPDELTDLVDLTEAEVEAITAVNRKFAEAYAAGLVKVVTDLNGGQAPEIPENAPAWAVIPSFVGSMAASVPDETAAAIRRSIAQERAGLATAPEDHEALDPVERFVRMQAAVGDDYEAALAQAVGPDRAHELRVAQDGWGSGTLYGGACPTDEPTE